VSGADWGAEKDRGVKHEQLDKHPKASWLRLPVWVRGYGDELLRHCDDTGLICDSRDARDVALVVRAQPDEVDQLAEAIDRLLAQGFLALEVSGLTIANYKTIRERRLARDRQKKSRQSRNVTGSHGSHETSHREEKRREEERIPPKPPDSDRDRASRWLRDRMSAELEWGDAAMWPIVAGVVEDFRSTWPAEKPPRHGGDPRARTILERVAEGYSRDELARAARGSKLDPNIADNPQYQTIRTVFRDAAQVDKFAALAEPPKPKRRRTPTTEELEALEPEL
jgi:hypothetical protein